MFSQDGTRAYQTTTVNDPATGWSSTVAVIDPTDGTVVGDPLTLNGFPSVGLVFSQDAPAPTKPPPLTIPPRARLPRWWR